MWVIEVYAIQRFKSVWVIREIPYTVNDNIPMNTSKAVVDIPEYQNEKIGIIILKKPNGATFRSTAASKTDASVDASTWASGNHDASGKTGNFIKNEIVNSKNEI